MKVLKNINITKEIEIDITAEDITDALNEDTDTLKQVLNGINNLSAFYKAITDEIIQKMTSQQREIIYTFLSNQANRYKNI
jgi:hypothetical protein